MRTFPAAVERDRRITEVVFGARWWRLGGGVCSGVHWWTSLREAIDYGPVTENWRQLWDNYYARSRPEEGLVPGLVVVLGQVDEGPEEHEPLEHVPVAGALEVDLAVGEVVSGPGTHEAVPSC